MRLILIDDDSKEGYQIIKMEIKMVFARKGGGVSRGSRVPHTYFEK